MLSFQCRCCINFEIVLNLIFIEVLYRPFFFCISFFLSVCINSSGSVFCVTLPDGCNNRNTLRLWNFKTHTVWLVGYVLSILIIIIFFFIKKGRKLIYKFACRSPLCRNIEGIYKSCEQKETKTTNRFSRWIFCVLYLCPEMIFIHVIRNSKDIFKEKNNFQIET